MSVRLVSSILLLASALSFAQRNELPAELTRGLSPDQVQAAVRGLSRAGPPECDSALACLSRSMENARIATALARENRSAEQIAIAIGVPSENAPSASDERVSLTIPKWAPRRGPASAPITIVTWLDYECPFSQRLHGTFKELEAAYPGKLRFVVRHNPLPFHNNAKSLALMSMVAHEQTRFWEFHDAMFESRPIIDRASLEKVSKERRYVTQLAEDQAEALRLGANGTPTSYVNGLKVEGSQPLATWRDLVDAELAAASPSKLGK
jgi:protein-disulfide isomerase